MSRPHLASRCARVVHKESLVIHSLFQACPCAFVAGYAQHRTGWSLAHAALLEVCLASCEASCHREKGLQLPQDASACSVLAPNACQTEGISAKRSVAFARLVAASNQLGVPVA